MKGKTIVLISAIAVIFGVLLGLLISAMVWQEEEVPFFIDFFTPAEDRGQIGEGKSGANPGAVKRGKENIAGYEITKQQQYYQSPVDKGSKNILLMGEDATSGNYDTLIVVSISEKSKTIKLLNFPRDIYMDYSDKVLDKLREMYPRLYEAKGFQKINAAHNVGARIRYEDGNGRFGSSGIDFLADIMEEVFLIPIDDFAYVNTKGFRQVVDLFDGVEINVPIRMNYEDPLQDLYIDLQPGLQHLDGKKAEEFVRFRQGYDKDGNFKNYSDEFRKQNQNEFLKAFFNQHAKLENIGKINELAKLISEHVRTSVTGVREVTSYANLLRKAITGKYGIESGIIECEAAKNINGVYFSILRSKQ